MTTRKYNKTKLDLQYNKKNDNLEFYVSDTDTSDFYIKITRANMPVDLKEVIVVLCVVDPKRQFRSQLINVNTDKEGIIYCNLDHSMKSVVGDYQAKIMLVYEDEKIVTDNFTYTIKNDSFVALNREVVSDDRFTVLTEMLSEISKIKNREDGRVAAETERVATIERIKSEIAQLTSDINSRVNANISENTTKTNELISSTNTTVNNSLNLNTSKVNELITRGNNSLSQLETNSTNLIASVETYKTDTTASIEEYKVTKDGEINQALTDYKTSTTQGVNTFVDGELLKIRNDLVVDTDAYKVTLNSKFTQLDTDLKSNVNNFILIKGNYIDNYVQNKTLELTTYMSTKNTELNNYIATKTSELNTYKTTKNAEIDKFFNDKNTEFNNNEKTRSSNESRRETNEYSRGLNETNRKAAEDKRVSSFAQMTSDFNSYKTEKDLAIQQDLQQYKNTTTQDIDTYKNAKNTEINQSLDSYENTIDILKTDFNSAVANVTNGNESATNTEIVLARKDEVTLKAKMDKIDEQFISNAKIITNYVNILSFGADKTGVNDSTSAIKNAIEFMKDNDILTLYIPTGTFLVEALNNNTFVLPENCVIQGDGENSVILFDDNPNTTKTFSSNCLFTGNNLKTIKFSNFKINGKVRNYLSSKETNAVPFVYLANVDTIIFENMYLNGSRTLTTHIENPKKVILTNNHIEDSLRDGFRVINASNVIAKGNYFKNVSDDSIAIHSNNNFTEINQGIIISNNIFEFSQGISAFGGKIIDINNNIFKRCPYACIGVNFSNSGEEGNTPIHNISIKDNLITDKIYTVWGGSEIIKINGQSITQDGSFIPSIFKAPYGYNYLKGSNITGIPAVHNLDVSGNKIVRTLPNVTKISDWGYGSILSRSVNGCIYDGEITDYSWSGYGIQLIGSIYNSKINNNIICGLGSETFLGSAIIFQDNGNRLSRYNVELKNNQIYDLKGVAINFSTGKNSNVVVSDNIFDLDPFFRNSKHNTDNTWVANSSSFASCLGGNLKGVTVNNNQFSNCFNPMTSNATIIKNNVAFADGKQSDFNKSINKGVDVLGGVDIIQIHGDVNEVNFRELYETRKLMCENGSILTSIGQSITASTTVNGKRLTSELINIEVGKKYKIDSVDSNIRIYPLFSNSENIELADQWRTVPFTFNATYSKVRFVIKYNDETDITSLNTELYFKS